MAFKLTSSEDLFPTPLLQFEVSDAAKLNKALLQEIAKRHPVEGGMAKSNRKGWHSERDLFERREPAHATLAQLLLRIMAQATKRVAPDTDFNGVELVADGWVNVNPSGAYNSPHDHLGGFWSGVYYVRMPKGAESGGAIEFLSPHKPLPGNNIIVAPVTAHKVVISPKAGTVLLFPSSLIHWVQPNDSDEERVTIAFNGFFRKMRSAPQGAAIWNQRK